MVQMGAQDAVAGKAPLDRETLRDVIDLALWSGQLLLQNGAESERIEETVHRVGTALGADWMDVVVTPEAVIITTISGEEFRTKVRRIVTVRVNLTVVAEINALSRRVETGNLDRLQMRHELRRISDARPVYNRWLVVGMVGLACAAFSRLFGGDMVVFAITFLASASAQFVRQELAHRYFNTLLVTIVTAFTAGIIASSATLFNLSPEPQTALAASVLLLVPGVPLINCVQDMIKGYLVTGIVRGVFGALITVCIALGLLLAMQLMGVSL